MGAENDNSAGASKNGKGKAIRKDNITSALWKDFTFEVPGFHDEVFWDWKDVIVASEMQILKRLGFHMQVGDGDIRLHARGQRTGRWSAWCIREKV
jgi:hypothetical protein